MHVVSYKNRVLQQTVGDGTASFTGGTNKQDSCPRHYGQEEGRMLDRCVEGGKQVAEKGGK